MGWQQEMRYPDNQAGMLLVQSRYAVGLKLVPSSFASGTELVRSFWHWYETDEEFDGVLLKLQAIQCNVLEPA